MKVFLDIARGSKDQQTQLLTQHNDLKTWLASNGSNYGLPSSLDECDDSARETLVDVFESANVRTQV